MVILNYLLLSNFLFLNICLFIRPIITSQLKKVWKIPKTLNWLSNSVERLNKGKLFSYPEKIYLSCLLPTNISTITKQTSKVPAQTKWTGSREVSSSELSPETTPKRYSKNELCDF